VSFQLQKVGAGIVWDLWEEHQAYETCGDFYRHPDSIHNDRHMTIVDIQYLVGALEHFFCFSIQLGIYHHPNWRSHMFQRGWNHQPGITIIPICSMYGIFTYKTRWFLGQMLVNIPAPWSIWDKITSGLFILLDWWHGTHVRPEISRDHQMKSSFESMKTMGVSECSP
jgi:hypothetical protein